MGRGRKQKSKNDILSWSAFFNKNIGNYIQTIIIDLGKSLDCGPDSANELLQQIKIHKRNKKISALTEIKYEERPFEIPKNWVWCRLGDIIEFSETLNIETKLPKDTLINYVDIDAIDNQNFIIRENKLKRVSELSSRARRVLKKGSIVYSLVRPYLNNIAIVDEDIPNHIGSTGFAVFTGILVDNKYIKFILLSDYVRELFLSMLTGFNSPTITQQQFCSTPIPLPPLSEQKNILSFLSDFENEIIEDGLTYFNEQIEKNIIKTHNSQLLASELKSELSSQLELVDDLNLSILQEAMQGNLVKQDPIDEPAVHLLNLIKEKKENLIKAKKLRSGKSTAQPVSFINDYIIPKNWLWCKIDEIFFVTKLAGFEYTNHIQLKKSGDIPVVRAQNVRPLNIDKSNILFIDKKTSIMLDRCSLTKKCLLITFIGAGIGDVATFNESERWHLAPNVAKVEPFDGCEDMINVTFINYFFMSNIGQKELFKHIKATAQPSLSMGTIRDIDIPLPPIHEQNRIVSEIEAQFAITKLLKEHVKANQGAVIQLLEVLLRPQYELKTKMINESELSKVNNSLVISPDTEYYKVGILAAEIVYQLHKEQTFGHLKLQKLIYLCQKTTQMKLSTNFLKQAMGPYDPKLMRLLDSALMSNNWFKYNQTEILKYKPLSEAGNHRVDFNKYFGKEKEQIQFLIDNFRSLKSDVIEIVATLYSCLDQLLVDKSIYSEQFLLKRFYEWSDEKRKFSEKQVRGVFRRMIETGLIPKDFKSDHLFS